MAKSKFPSIVTPIGEAIYPHLTKADTKFDAEGKYHTKLRMRASDAETLVAKLTEVRDAAYAELDPIKRKKLKLADVVEVETDDNGDETGNVIIKASLKVKGKTREGEEFTQQPKLWDSDNNPVDLKAVSIWGGSRLRLSCQVIPFEMVQAKQFAVTLRLKAVQIIELVEGGGGESPFGKAEGFKKSKFDDAPEDGGEDDGGDF